MPGYIDSSPAFLSEVIGLDGMVPLDQFAGADDVNVVFWKKRKRRPHKLRVIDDFGRLAGGMAIVM